MDTAGVNAGSVSLPASPVRLLAATGVGYLAGAIPSADIATRLAGSSADLRTEGSGNPGALNAATVLGPRWGYAVLAADMAKGALGGAAGRMIGGDTGAYLAAAASIGGHIAPVTKGFRGGKGVATSAGACLAVFPAYFPIDAAVATLTALTAQHAERSVRISCGAWVGASVLWWRRDLPNAWGPAPGPAMVAFAAGSSVMILAKFAASRRGQG